MWQVRTPQVSQHSMDASRTYCFRREIELRKDPVDVLRNRIVADEEVRCDSRVPFAAYESCAFWSVPSTRCQRPAWASTSIESPKKLTDMSGYDSRPIPASPDERHSPPVLPIVRAARVARRVRRPRRASMDHHLWRIKHPDTGTNWLAVLPEQIWRPKRSS